MGSSENDSQTIESNDNQKKENKRKRGKRHLYNFDVIDIEKRLYFVTLCFIASIVRNFPFKLLRYLG